MRCSPIRWLRSKASVPMRCCGCSNAKRQPARRQTRCSISACASAAELLSARRWAWSDFSATLVPPASWLPPLMCSTTSLAGPRAACRCSEANIMSHTPLLLGAVAYDPKVVTIWDGFRRYFEKLGLSFDYILYTSYERQVEALFAGQIDVAWNSPLAWLESERLASALGLRAEA